MIIPVCRSFRLRLGYLPQFGLKFGAALLSLALALAVVGCAATPQDQRGGGSPQDDGEARFRDLDDFLSQQESDSPFVVRGVKGVSLEGAAQVGLLLPLSGQHAPVGQALLNAAQLALYDIADDKFQLIVEDTKGTPEGARVALRAALTQGAQLILGPLFYPSVEAISAEAARAGVSVITFSNNRAVAGPNTFVVGLSPRDQIVRIVGYAASQGLQRFAVLVPDSPYGASVVAALQEAVEASAGELARVTFYPPTLQDVSAEARILANYDERHAELLDQRRELEEREDEAAQLALKRLEGRETLGPPEFDAVLIPEGGERLLTVAPLLAFYDVDPAEVRYLGTALWEDADVFSEPVLRGGWFVAPAPSPWLTFKQRYEETFGSPPPRVATLAYDTTALAAVLAQQAGQGGREVDYSPAVLTQTSGFAGIDGIFRFLPSGEVERGYAVLEVRRQEFRTLDTAPASFDQLIN